LFSPAALSPISTFVLSDVAQRLQDLWLSRAISESTWGYPVVGAVHVLAIAFWGGTILVGSLYAPEETAQLRAWKRITLSVVLVTGILIFMSNAVRYSNSRFFEAKIVLLLLMALIRRRPYISLVLWIAVIFASRGIAFF